MFFSHQRSARCLTLLLLLGASACNDSQLEPRSASTEQAEQAPDASALFHMAEQQARQGDNLRAEQYLLAAQRAGYPQQQTLPVLLTVCLAQGRLRSALGHAEPYLRDHPNDHRLRQLVAAIYLGLGEVARGFRELQRVEEQAPGYAPAKYLLGVIADESFADTEAAQHYFEQYLKLEPHGEHAAETVNWLREHSMADRHPMSVLPTKAGS